MNLFLLDWDREDHGDVCFNDLLHGLYRAERGDYLQARDFPHSREPYSHRQIPAALFEDVVWKHFDIGLDEFRQRAFYDAESDSYP